MCPELSYNHQASRENIPAESGSHRRLAVKAERGAPACVMLLSRCVQSLSGARIQIWDGGERGRESQ